MLPLDPETADYMTAFEIREALAEAPANHYVTVEATVRALFHNGLLPTKTAIYALLNLDRFKMTSAPSYIEAVWHIEAAQIPSSTVSAHPFLTAQP